VQMTINDPKPGPMPGFYEVKIRGASGPQSQEETFYVSRDGQKIVRGMVFDINQNPFKADLDKIRTEGQPSFGTPGAPVVIAEFSDFECPYCREQAKMLRDNIVKTYPKEVRVYFFDFPLTQIHPWAKAAAIDGRCIFRQSVSAYWDYHDWIFENQKDITPENLKDKVLEFAKTKTKPGDVDMAQLTSCIDTRATESDIDKTIAIAQSLGINQTPTTFVNGRRLPGSTAWNDLKCIVDYEIGYQKTAKNAGEDCGCDLRLPTPGVATPAGTSSLRH
jgi:protein-disulfide isomerase